MTDSGSDSRLFEDLTRDLLQQGVGVRFRARGASMSPAIRDGEMVYITPVIVSKLRKDDIVLTKSENGFRLHRIVLADYANDAYITRGDCGRQDDPPLSGSQILGLAQAKEVRVGRSSVQAELRGIGGWVLRSAARGQVLGKRLWSRVLSPVSALFPMGMVLCLLLSVAAPVRAQVVLDATSSSTAMMTGAGNHTLTFNHATSATANRLLLVGISMNISGVTGATVTGVTYGGTALTSVGSQNDAAPSRRVEIWSLPAPASGATNSIVITVSLPAAGTVGLSAGATTFTGVDQTTPLGTFVSANGAAGTFSQLDVPSVVNGMVLDTLAIGGNRTVTVPGPQASQWNLSTGGLGTDVRGTGSTRTGAPSVPVSESFTGGTSNWSLGAISINPSAADIAVTTGVSAVAFGQNSTYTITVTNNGPSPANNITLTDTFAASNLSLVSYTPSGGTTCTLTSTINCTLPTPFAKGTTATLTVIVSTTAPGYYPNTATIADSNLPPDPNTGNNTYVALAPVVTIVCGNSAPSASGTISGVLNTYYPGTASIAAGATSVPIGAANGTGTIASGSILLVIQMQDASISTANSIAYGNGYTGSGFTAINNAGNYEFVMATGPVSSGSVPILGAGAGAGLVFGYTAATASATKGASTYQVVLVPQYSSATFSSATPPSAPAWNGSTGGILALDVAAQLNLGGAAVSVTGLGFRGGAGLQMSGGGGSSTDFEQPSPATYTPTTTGSTSTGQAGWDASKGEGIAGTPMWVESGGTFLQTTTTMGYPSGTAGTDGSMARGAPGNAGGGGTDADPQGASPGGNDQNVGGGGGGNGGSGGFGGDSWSTNLSDGGEGGAAFPATIDRIALGGGGGAGTRNNSDGDNQASSASAGGGIIFIRVGTLSGAATLTANGANSYNGTLNDAGGGAGAGGTIIVLSAGGGESGLTLQANGGRGGDAWDSRPYSLADRHGPGGGGAGGVVLVSGAPASVSVSGGANGTTLNPGVAYGATSGTAGTSLTSATIAQVTGVQSAEFCANRGDLSITKSHGGVNFTRGATASYTLALSNVASLGATGGVVTVNDTLPFGITPTSAAGTGWTCTTTGQTISCTRSDALAAGASYPSITINANVQQSAPATLTNTGEVGGGGDVSPVNDTSTDTANVISTADLSVTDAGSPNPVAAGGNITYTQVVTNSGPSAADNAILVANIPANTTLVSVAAPAGWSCITPGAGGTGNVVCNNVDVAALAAGSFTMVVKVNSGTANGTVITGVVSVSSSVNDPITANNTASVATVVGTTANGEMVVANTASPDPVVAGNDITYTQVSTNVGSGLATNPTLTENTPANTTFVSLSAPPGTSCTTPPVGQGGAISCTGPSAPAGSSGTIVLVVQVAAATPAGTIITNTVTVTATNQAFGANSATATDVVAGATQADLALSTAATPAAVFAGNDITYTQTITNNGPAAASGVSFTEATPLNTTFQSVLAPAGWTCTTPVVGNGGTVNCTDPNPLAAGASADIIVVVNVPSTVAAGTITANSSITATTTDPNAANNSTTVATPVTVACDLGVTNSGTPSPVAAGGIITYTQVVTNSGPSNCSTATFTEATPTNTTFASVAVVTTGGGSWTCPNAAPVSCTNPSVPPGSIATITAKYTVSGAATSGTIISDTANVATTSRDTNPANNTATFNIAVASGTQADLSVTNAASPNPVAAGGNITYTQTVNNGGPAVASAVVLAETLPANTTFVSLSGPAGWTCTTSAPYTCSDTTNLAVGSASFIFVVNVGATVAPGSTITQTDSVSSSTVDPNSGNNSATVNLLVAGSADLSVTNAASPVPVLAGSNITYTQVVNNAGPSTATTVTLTETLPANTTALSLSGPAGWTCNPGTFTCTDPSLAPSSPATITYVLKVTAGTLSGTAINETATVSSAVTDPNTANNSATAADVVATGAQADLVATNSASPTSVAAGSNVTYTQSVQNLGPAPATSATFTQNTPPNTNFQSITPPAGWICGTVPAVGGTGTITCTDSSILGPNATAGFTLVLQVNTGTPSGTFITETDSASAANKVAAATASATVIVANANSADVAIVKTATPNPVTEGTPLTYTLTVSNNGPASATNVTVTDSLPSVVTYLSSTTTQGSCSEAGGTVTCLLATMANAQTATISILTIPQQPGVVSNTATVTADQTDPNPANNSSTQTETITAPTKVTLQSFSAHSGTDDNGASRVLLAWKSGGEAHNLGFNLYRGQAGNLVRVNSSLIAGSALLMSGALPKHAGRSYVFIDPAPAVAGAAYWLEDVDVNGTRTMHGPVSLASGTQPIDTAAEPARTFSQLSQAQLPGADSQPSHALEAVPAASVATPDQLRKQFELAAHPAVKILVDHEGWYRVSEPELVKAGLDPNIDPAMLRLYADAVEQPIQITGATPGRGGFGPQAAISFYGTGIDTVFSGNRVYWLAECGGKGARIRELRPSSGSNLPPVSFPATVELRQRTIYFAALLTQDGDNFFGALISPSPVDQILSVSHLNQASAQNTHLEIVLQGVIVGFPHDVKVTLNGTPVGDVIFTGQAKGHLAAAIPPGILQDGDNTVTLTAQNGDYDTSLVQSIQITYPHKYIADRDQLKFTGRAGDEVAVTDFTTVPIVLDITDPNRPVQIARQVTSNNGTYDIRVQVPWTTTNPASPVRHTLMAVGTDHIASPVGLHPSHPSHWHSVQPGADIVMVTYEAFADALAPLVHAHRAEGKSVAVVPVTELYDEFSFGEHSPFAIRQFLESANQNWAKAPSYLLLNGRASLDPRNYLGLGHLDLVPTAILPASSLMTASDDWFSDFSGTGMPTIATGRLPVGTVDESKTVVSKIAGYESQTPAGTWTSQALLVADRDDTESFSQDSEAVKAQLPAAIQATEVLTSLVGTSAARQDIIDGINSGQVLVNYLGHGSEEQWSGSDIFDTTSVTSLTNGQQLPVFLIMNCLNGFFQDVYSQPLGVTLLLAPNGGAVAVLASTGLNQPAPQTKLDKLVVENATHAPRSTLGESILKAKSQIGDRCVRETFVLFGDPAMKIEQPAGNAAAH
jgi:uncharacterized repeat protein (TIGR01451 family)